MRIVSMSRCIAAPWSPLWMLSMWAAASLTLPPRPVRPAG